MLRLNFKEILKFIYIQIPLLFAFLIPAGHEFYSPVLVLWGLLSIAFFVVYKQGELSVLKQSFWLWFYFLLTVLSNYLFFNPEDAFSAIEVKFSFLALPLLFAVYPNLNDFFYKLLLNAFVSGTLFWSIVQLIRSIVMFFIHHDSSCFFYTEFSYFIHPSYYAMYVCTAILFIHHYEILPPPMHKIKYLIYFLFAVSAVLASSKIGIICLVIVMGTLLFETLQKKYPFWITLSIITLGFVLIISIVYMMEPVRNRFMNVIQNIEQPLDKSSTESNMVRRLVWIADETVVERMPWYGYGVANVNKVLSEEYDELDFTGAKQRNLNAHNQYYQTLIGLGWPGFLVLVLIHLDFLFYGILQRNRVWLYILLVMILNFLVESMLQRAAGSVYFAFITILLCLDKKIKCTST